jgi:5'-3' exoribonuclease 2
MLLRGVKLPVPALNGSDIEELKGKARNSGRSYRGAPLGRGNNRGRINYGPDSRRGGHDHQSSQYNNGNRHNGPSAYPIAPVIPPGWTPPPPGFPGFGNGLPPPPPRAYQGGGRGGYGNGHDAGYGNHRGSYGGNHGYNQQQYAPPAPPPYNNYGGQYTGPPPGHQGQNRRPHDDGRGRGGQRGGRGYGQR